MTAFLGAASGRAWLETLLPGDVLRLLAIAATLVVLLLVYRVLLRLLDRLLAGAGRRVETALRAPRSRTVVSTLSNVAYWVIGFVGLVMVLRELGVDVQALLVSAGVVGFAVGFGAQTLIRDLITGFFLLFEGLVAVDDVIEVGGRIGRVEAVGLRVTRIRQDDGALRIVPNGALTEFTNFSTGRSQAVVDVGVDRAVPVDRALDTLRGVGEEWARVSGAALDRPRAQGIMRWSGDAMVLRLTVTVDPARRFDVEAELRRRVKDVFDREQWRISAP